MQLDLSNNQLSQLPADFGQLSQLQRLDLYSNQLTTLPLSFSQLTKLKWLDLKNNPLDADLGKAAGLCLSERECKECAKKVQAVCVLSWQASLTVAAQGLVLRHQVVVFQLPGKWFAISAGDWLPKAGS